MNLESQMRVTFLNPPGNLDPGDSYWTEHPDFGGQLVYIKQVALAMGELGHQVDLFTWQILDPDWPQFSKTLDGKTWKEAVCIAYQIATFKFQKVGHVKQLINKELIYNQVEKTLVKM